MNVHKEIICLDESQKRTKDLKEEIKKTASGGNFDYFVTLNFRIDVGKETALKSLKKFIKKINNEFYGSRSNKSVHFLPFLEGVKYGMLHFHALISDPRLGSLKKNGISEDKMRLIVNKTWKDSGDYTADMFTSTKQNGIEWFKPLWYSEGASSYGIKTMRNTDDADVVLWEMWMKGKRNYQSYF